MDAPTICAWWGGYPASITESARANYNKAAPVTSPEPRSSGGYSSQSLCRSPLRNLPAQRIVAPPGDHVMISRNILANRRTIIAGRRFVLYGSSYFGGGGRGSAESAAQAGAGTYGAGGGGGATDGTGTPSGAGGDGFVYVEEYA